jgi:hypothetical protein
MRQRVLGADSAASAHTLAVAMTREAAASSLRNKISRNAASYLAPGEQLQSVIPGSLGTRGETGTNVALIATDRRFLMFKLGVFRASRIRTLLAEFPRDTRVGPEYELRSPLSREWYEFRSPSREYTIWIMRRFFDDILAADAARPREPPRSSR